MTTYNSTQVLPTGEAKILSSFLNYYSSQPESKTLSETACDFYQDVHSLLVRIQHDMTFARKLNEFRVGHSI